MGSLVLKTTSLRGSERNKGLTEHYHRERHYQGLVGQLIEPTLAEARTMGPVYRQLWRIVYPRRRPYSRGRSSAAAWAGSVGLGGEASQQRGEVPLKLARVEVAVAQRRSVTHRRQQPAGQRWLVIEHDYQSSNTWLDQLFLPGERRDPTFSL